MAHGKFTAMEPGFGFTVSQVGPLVQIIVKTPFGAKAVHFTSLDARLIGDCIGFASNDARAVAAQQAREREAAAK